MTKTLDFQEILQTALAKNVDPLSHVERDPWVIHASQVSQCDRQAYLSKIGGKDNTGIYGAFRLGTMWHEYWEHNVPDVLAETEDIETLTERFLVLDNGRGKIIGSSDLIAPSLDRVYDYKWRSFWYDHSKEPHINQINAYMAAAREAGLIDDPTARIIYFTLTHGGIDVREYPPSGASGFDSGVIEFDPGRVDEMVERMVRVGDEIALNGYPGSPSDIPFHKCGCFYCEKEKLSLPSTAEEEWGEPF